MKSSILITGISGFVGSALLKDLDFFKFKKVYLLVPEEEAGSLKRVPENTVVLQGDMTGPALEDLLPQEFDTVLHMAALTGKAPRRAYDKVNFEAFRDIITIGKERGLKNVLFVSTIAVKFRKRSRYFYSYSKEKAENFLTASGLKYSIIRPTMILGGGSPVFRGFSMFGGLPLIPLFGGGRAVVQPVHLKDISAMITHILHGSIYDNSVYDAGGPDRISIRDFLKKISEAKGKTPRFLPVPMWIPVSVISVLDRIIYPLLPLTMGQLATFRNDSLGDGSTILKGSGRNLTGIDKMISDSIAGEIAAGVYRKALTECRVFTKYMIGRKPTSYNEMKYVEFLEKSGITPFNRFDRILSGIAAGSPFLTKFCDGYSRFFFPHSTLRKKLGTLFAILETSPETYKSVDDIRSGNRMIFLLSLGFRGAWFAFHLFLSILVFLPLQVLTGRVGAAPAKGGALE